MTIPHLQHSTAPQNTTEKSACHRPSTVTNASLAQNDLSTQDAHPTEFGACFVPERMACHDDRACIMARFGAPLFRQPSAPHHTDFSMIFLCTPSTINRKKHASQQDWMIFSPLRTIHLHPFFPILSYCGIHSSCLSSSVTRDQLLSPAPRAHQTAPLHWTPGPRTAPGGPMGRNTETRVNLVLSDLSGFWGSDNFQHLRRNCSFWTCNKYEKKLKRW